MDLSRIVQRRNHSLWILLALIPTSLAYLLYYKGILKMKETSKVPIIASVEMIATAIISVAFFGEYFVPCRHLRHCAGCCLYCPNEHQNKRTAPIERTRLACTTVTTFRRIFPGIKVKRNHGCPCHNPRYGVYKHQILKRTNKREQSKYVHDAQKT